MPGGPHPSHPIAPGGKPPGIWGGGNEGFPTHPIVIPPGFIDGVHPEHPIVIPPPQQPPGIWGGRPPEYIDIGLPGPQPGPGHPAHPIVIPPDLGIWPDDEKPTHPIVIPPPTVIWPPRPTHPIAPGGQPPTPTHPIAPGGPPPYPAHPIPPTPTHPIVLPPDGPPQVMENWDVVAYWTAEGGWAVAVVPVGDQPVPTPSAT
jgi:hypothetical protein